MEPKLLALAFAYAYGRPRERPKVMGADTRGSQIVFYLPSNQRDVEMTQIAPSMGVGIGGGAGR
jgi:hypothetical protein